MYESVYIMFKARQNEHPVSEIRTVVTFGKEAGVRGCTEP